MAKPMFTTHQSLLAHEIRWFYEPPRARTVLVQAGHGFYRWRATVPGAMFGVRYIRGRPASLYCYAAKREPSDADDPVIYYATKKESGAMSR